MKIILTKAIKRGDEEILEIELREPTAGDVMECGYPLAIGEGEATPNAEAIGKLIARLAGLPPSSIKQMSMADFNEAMGVVLGFFGK